MEIFKSGDLGLGPTISFETVQISINVDKWGTNGVLVNTEISASPRIC